MIIFPRPRPGEDQADYDIRVFSIYHRNRDQIVCLGYRRTGNAQGVAKAMGLSRTTVERILRKRGLK